MEAENWRRFHESDVPPVVLQKIYVLIRRQWIPHLSIPFLSARNPRKVDPLPIKSNSLPYLHGIPAIQGWLSVSSNPPHDIGYRSKRELWVSISLGLLSFSLSPASGAPEACLALTGMQSHWDGDKIILQKSSRSDSATAATAGSHQVTLSLLRPDGSWKECQFAKMELGFSSASPENPHIWLQWLAESAIDMNSV